MGQGAGNLQTELISFHLNTRLSFERYSFSTILDACEIIERYKGEDLWGYSVTRMIPAVYKTAYKYSLVFRKKYHLGFVSIERIIKNMPAELRNRYTKEDAESLVKNDEK